MLKQFLSAAALLLTASAPALAEPIPQDWLAAQHKSCLQACTGGGKSSGACQTYCTCVDNGFSASLSKQEYIDVDTAVRNKQPLSEEVSAKIKNVTDRCLPPK
jgi:hypothetical protein